MIEEIVLTNQRLAIPVLADAGMESRIDQHFGKSKGFILINSDGTNCEYLDAALARGPSECAPISALVKSGARAVLCRGMGKGALVRCHEAGMLVGQSVGRTVAEALENLQLGRSIDFPDSALCSHGDSCDGEEGHGH